MCSIDTVFGVMQQYPASSCRNPKNYFSPKFYRIVPETRLPQHAGCLLDGVLTTCVWGFCRYTGDDDILSVMASFVADAIESPFRMTPPTPPHPKRLVIQDEVDYEVSEREDGVYW